MKLKIRDLAKIKSADIEIDGLTVIAGENNTGKSTVGKVLYATFNSMYNMNEKIENEKEREIEKVCNDLIFSLPMNSQLRRTSRISTLPRRMSNSVYEHISLYGENGIKRETVEQILTETFEQYRGSFSIDSLKSSEYFDTAVSKILNLIKMSDNYKVSLELITRFFQQAFDSQIMCLNGTESKPQIQLQIKEQNLTLRFDRNDCVSCDSEYNILHEAFFIDDPFMVDDLQSYLAFYMASVKGIRYQMVERIRMSSNNLAEGIFDAVAAKESLNEIDSIMNTITNGKIISQNGDLRLAAENLTEPLAVDNLSAGLKSFVIIKMLLERGILKEKDVLILDEPEIHLHPEWQLKYAEIIVLLQRQFDLSILVTTHSRDFLEAIELYSKKYGIEPKCRYYLSRVENGGTFFDDVTGNLNKIYGQMVTASMLLDQLRYSMVEADE